MGADRMVPTGGSPLVLFFGSARPGEYDTLLDAGLPLGLLRDTTSANSRHIPRGFTYLDELPFTRGVEDVLTRVASIQQRQTVACLVVSFEGHVELAAEVSARLGLRGLTADCARVVRDKTLMHERLVEVLGADCTGRFAGIRGVEDALAFARNIGFPVVVKPRRLHSSMYVTPCRDAAELTAAVVRLQAAVPLFAENGGAGTTLHIEEYLPGTNHSVDVVSTEERSWPTPVIDVITGAELGADDFHHFARITPTALGGRDQQEAASLAVRAAQALGVAPGVAHVELIRSPDGLRVVEVGGRPGGNRHRLLNLGWGLDLCRANIDVLQGRLPRLSSTRNAAVAVATPYPARAGRLHGFAGLDRVKALPGVRSVQERAVPGDMVGTPRDGASPPLSIELHAASRDALIADLSELAMMRSALFDVQEVDP